MLREACQDATTLRKKGFANGWSWKVVKEKEKVKKKN